MLWIACSLALLGAGTDSQPTGQVATDTIRATKWDATSANFVIHNHSAAHDARQVAEHCERWRTKLQKYWIATEQESWAIKCDVVVHAGIGTYLQAVGAGGRQTFGSSLIKFDDGRQVARRLIDFRGDSPLGLAAVPHEMTHVILADLLGGRQPPRWADEGMAILADSHDKQMLHERDLTHSLANRAAFRVAELLTIESYPSASRIPAFYGQSASLTACMAQRDDPAKFVEFLRRSLDSGYDQALREVYHLDNIAALETVWHSHRQSLAQRNSGNAYHGVRLAIDEAVLEAASRSD
jgi:hypothetical protein